MCRSVFDWVRAENLDGKLANSAIYRAEVPNGYRDDARQEIYLDWSRAKVDETLEYNRVAAYAHLIAIRAAMRARRELANPVRLPGSAFRDGSALTPACVLPAADLSDLDTWLDMGEAHTISMAPHDQPEEGVIPARDRIDTDQIQAVKAKLSTREWRLVADILAGYSLLEHAEMAGITYATAFRSANRIKAKVNLADLMPT